MSPQSRLDLTRRAFLTNGGMGLGSIALWSLLQGDARAATKSRSAASSRDGDRDGASGPFSGYESHATPPAPHFAPKAKRVIYLFMSGAPSHIDLFDPKPLLKQRQGDELPGSVRNGQRITGMTSGQSSFPVVGAAYGFKRYGQLGVEMSEMLPHIGEIADDITLIRSMYTEPINHDPAVTYLLTGNQQPGRPTLGAWVAYGLGSENKNLPEFIVLLSGAGGQPLLTRYWHNGFLPGRYQGVQFRGSGDPVLYVNNPPGVDANERKSMLDDLKELDTLEHDAVGDPAIETRIHAYELAYRMQSSVPELMDIAKEPKEVLEMYGAEPGKPSFANNCLLARRLIERGVRYVQLYHRDWDHHSDLPVELKKQCTNCDRSSAALIKDLKRLGMLDDTLVIWGGEFGRTAYSQGPITANAFGRDHHPRCFSLWMAGGGIKRGFVIGKTDDFGYNIVESPIHVHDFQATILHCLGVDHEKLTYRFQGRDFRLTDVEGKVVREILA
jgi:Protein of unknown function (DUF1501)